MPIATITDFERHFAFAVMATAAASSLGIALALLFLTTGAQAPGVFIGFLGSVLGLGLMKLGHHHTALRTFFSLCTIGIWIASGSPPIDQEAIGSATASWLLLGIMASLLLPLRSFILFASLCWFGVVTLSIWVLSQRLSADTTQIPGLPGATVAITFLPVGFFLLGLVATHFRTTIERLETAEHDARRALQTKSRFLANMSHELRTPLNAILGYSEMLLEEAQDEPNSLREAHGEDDLNRIHGAATTLLGHINALLDLSKIDAGRMETYIESVDLSEVIHEVVALHRPLTAQRENRVIAELDPNLMLNTDRQKVVQILTNLLSNANKFTDKGRITIRANRTEQGVFLQIEDTGIGIPAEALPGLFDAFTQADSSTTKRFGGTGLGLALVKEFSSLLGGKVEVVSTPKVGSTFTVNLTHLPATTSP